MKKTLLIFLITSVTAFAQGKLSGEFKNIIGQIHSIEQPIKSLKTFRNEQGIVIGDVTEGKFFSTIDVYKKGTTAVVVLSKKISTTSEVYRIIDVVKVISIPKNYELRITDCSRNNGYPDETIVAIVFSGTKRKVKIIKEAYALKDSSFEKISIKGIQCTNQGID